MKITKRNKIFGVFGVLIVIFILLVLLYKPVIFQEGNPYYPLLNVTETNNTDSIEWTEYKNKEYSFTFRYPALSVDNQLWGNLTETLPLSEILLPNQVLSKNNNFYLHQKYNISTDWQTGKTVKKENTFIPKYDNTYAYPLAWHFIIFDVEAENDLDKIIKQKLGPGCSYKTKIATEFSGNYRIEIDGDGKDLGSTLCPVNYTNYIIYSPDQKKVAFWSTGQECQIGYGFEKCFDKQIAESFHFIKQTDLKICPFEVAGFKFSYPKTWGDCKFDGQKISFRTDFKKYNVDLVAELRETSKEMAQGFIDYSIKQEKIDSMDNAIIYRGICGGGIACSILNINNQKFYEINWDVVSNQPAPENLDGVWVPDHSFTDDDIWTILRSAKNY